MSSATEQDSAPINASTRSVKVDIDGKHRRFALSEADVATFGAFASRIAQALDMNIDQLRQQYSISWTDDDGDSITVDSDLDMTELLDHFPQLIRIQMHRLPDNVTDYLEALFPRPPSSAPDDCYTQQPSAREDHAFSTASDEELDGSDSARPNITFASPCDMRANGFDDIGRQIKEFFSSAAQGFHQGATCLGKRIHYTAKNASKAAKEAEKRFLKDLDRLHAQAHTNMAQAYQACRSWAEDLDRCARANATKSSDQRQDSASRESDGDVAAEHDEEATSAIPDTAEAMDSSGHARATTGRRLHTDDQASWVADQLADARDEP